MLIFLVEFCVMKEEEAWCSNNIMCGKRAKQGKKRECVAKNARGGEKNCVGLGSFVLANHEA